MESARTSESEELDHLRENCEAVSSVLPYGDEEDATIIVTITNVSGAAINKLSTAEDGVGTGGARTKEIPYPFSWVGEMANGATKVFAVHPADFRVRDVVNGSAFDARALWNQAIQMKLLTFAQAAQTGRRDVEELFINAV